jgi:hypothetical protein
LTDPINDYYDRIEAMCLAAITDSVVVPDWTIAQPGGLWWAIKLITGVPGFRTTQGTRFDFSWDIIFVQAAVGTGAQGATRQELYTNVWTILTYFERNINLTTSTLEKFEELIPGVEFSLSSTGIGQLQDSNQVRMASFSLEFNSSALIERTL